MMQQLMQASWPDPTVLRRYLIQTTQNTNTIPGGTVNGVSMKKTVGMSGIGRPGIGGQANGMIAIGTSLLTGTDTIIRIGVLHFILHHQIQMPCKRSPCTSSLTPSLSSGSLEVQEVAGMLRSRTGDIVPMVVQPTEQEQVSGTADGSVENAHKNANEDNTSAKGGGNGTSQTEKTEGPGGGGETQNGKAEDSGSTKDPDQVPIDPELEKKKKAAHARYMRYYRSIRSHCLSQTFALCVSKHSS